ncbi:hypothetical protein V1507DRAFT_460173 [Lipomyces tetrasporus]
MYLRQCMGTDFIAILGEVPIDTERDRRTIERATKILKSTEEKDTLIRLLSCMLPWTEFIEHANLWICQTSCILDKAPLYAFIIDNILKYIVTSHPAPSNI